MQRKPWTQEEKATLRRLYPDHRAEDVARVLKRTTRQIYNKASALGLQKSAAFFASEASGRSNCKKGGRTRFKPGHTPWNAGVKGYDPGGRSAETRFKKGRPPQEARNYRPIGSTRITKDGYLERKISDDRNLVPARRWKAIHRIVWEAEHGPVPKGHIVVFKPGQKTTNEAAITLDKLEMITQAENMRRNTYHRYPQPIPQLVQLRGALNRKINRSNDRDEKQN